MDDYLTGASSQRISGSFDQVLTAETIVDAWNVSNPVVSPDGRWVAYVRRPVGHPREQPVSEVWLASTKTPPRRLAAGSNPRWALDSGSVFVVDDSALRRITLSGTDTVVLTWSAGIDDFRPLADGVVLIAADEPSAQERRRLLDGDDAEVRGESRPSRLRLFRDGQIRVLYGDRHVSEVAQQPGGGPLAVLTWSRPEIDPDCSNPNCTSCTCPGRSMISGRR